MENEKKNIVTKLVEDYGWELKDALKWVYEMSFEEYQAVSKI